MFAFEWEYQPIVAINSLRRHSNTLILIVRILHLQLWLPDSSTLHLQILNRQSSGPHLDICVNQILLIDNYSERNTLHYSNSLESPR